jgi:hypothetical protein
MEPLVGIDRQGEKRKLSTNTCDRPAPKKKKIALPATGPQRGDGDPAPETIADASKQPASKSIETESEGTPSRYLPEKRRHHETPDCSAYFFANDSSKGVK